MLKEKFLARMKTLLGKEYESFEEALKKPPVKAIRINTLKADRDTFLENCDFDLKPLPFTDVGFLIANTDGIGHTPEHCSGQIYVQDPGAMSAVSAVDIKEGWWVLDLCAAPGGKSSQAAAKIGSRGFLLSNEYVAKRAKICVSNFERLGIKNAMVTSLDTGEFKKYFNGAFDLVIADAPCSGEGMFRKSNEAIDEWSEENVALCSKRQAEILNNAAPLVKPGGYLLYSTCTYSLEENEMAVDKFLVENPNFKLVEVNDALRRVTRDGISYPGSHSADLSLTRRYYPHVFPGEGQFVALMQRCDNEPISKTILYKDTTKEPSRDEKFAIEDFFKKSLMARPDGKLCKVGENLVLISHGCPPLPKSVFSAGVLLGEVRKGFLHPSHQFFSAFGNLFKNRIEISDDTEKLAKYLAGEEIDWDSAERGFCAVFYKGSTLGGGKLADGKLKNYYPKGLRIQNN